MSHQTNTSIDSSEEEDDRSWQRLLHQSSNPLEGWTWSDYIYIYTRICFITCYSNILEQIQINLFHLYAYSPRSHHHFYTLNYNQLDRLIELCHRSLILKHTIYNFFFFFGGGKKKWSHRNMQDKVVRLLQSFKDAAFVFGFVFGHRLLNPNG